MAHHDKLRCLARVLVLSCLCAFLSVAGCAGSAVQPPSRARDQALILDAMARSEQGWNSGDLKAHLAMYDPTVTFMTKNGPREGIAPIERSFEDKYFVDGKPKQQLHTGQLQIRFLSRDSALMTGRFVLSGGGLPELSGWFSLVWVRRGGDWKVVHDHSS